MPPSHTLHDMEYRVVAMVRLMRLDKPIGIALLFLPCLWAWLLAVHHDPSRHDLRMLAAFAVGAVLLRSAGCVINDLLDRDLDRHVARTKMRPLASGMLTARLAVLLLLGLMVCGLGIWLALPPLTEGIALIAAGMMTLYPLMKRITWWPQFGLGLTFNLGALMMWSALHGTLEAPAWWIYGGGILWTLAYDTIYACQDIEDDARIGVRSSARALGRWVKPAVSLFYLLALGCLAYAGALVGLNGWGFLSLMTLAALWVAFVLYRWNPTSPETSLAAFKASVPIGLLIATGYALG